MSVPAPGSVGAHPRKGNDLADYTAERVREVAGLCIDRAATLELRNGSLPTGKTVPLYEAAMAASNGSGLALGAAEALAARVQPGDRVLILTGAGAPPVLPQGENDGPPGAAAIARALYSGLRAVPVYVSEQHHQGPIVAASEGAGLVVRDRETARRYGVGAAALSPPVAQEQFGSWAETTFREVAPVAVISVELMGANHRGVMHSVTGRAGWAPSIDWHTLLQLCRSAGVLSIGIGDGGNEVGMGRIHDAVRTIQDYGERCQCPCGGGMATVEAADHLIVAGVSNWGGYALQAALALCLGDPELLQSAQVAEGAVRACTSAGALEGMYCTKDFSVDGVPGEVSVHLVEILRTIVRVALRPADVGPAH